jgi:mannose-6-phosphate isomerase-like protein (cupin superfamily)
MNIDPKDGMVALDEVLAAIDAQCNGQRSGPRYHYPLHHGTMKIGVYAPRSQDLQSPHTRDELYIVARGEGEFVKNGVRRRFKANDAIFVEAHANHCFENFSEDFATWVVFWGPEGGEGV